MWYVVFKLAGAWRMRDGELPGTTAVQPTAQQAQLVRAKTVAADAHVVAQGGVEPAKVEEVKQRLTQDVADIKGIGGEGDPRLKQASAILSQAKTDPAKLKEAATLIEQAAKDAEHRLQGSYKQLKGTGSQDGVIPAAVSEFDRDPGSRPVVVKPTPQKSPIPEVEKALVARRRADEMASRAEELTRLARMPGLTETDRRPAAQEALRLAHQAPRSVHLVAESGLSAPADLKRLAGAHVTSVLVGESLMRQKDVEGATRHLLGDGFRQ